MQSGLQVFVIVTCPFGVLVSDTVTLVIKADKWLTTVDQPEEVMQIWRDTIYQVDDFYDYHRGRALRIHHDYQAAGGVSAFPLSYGLGSDLVNLRKMIVTNEALTLHEHGHHADSSNIFLKDFSETAPNMGGKYAQAIYNKFSWKAELAVGRINNYLRSTTDDLWNHYNHYAVDMKGTFVDTIGAVWGWEKVKTIVHNITHLSSSFVNTVEKRTDQWLIQASNVVGFDISPFLKKWQLEFSAGAKNSVSHLPKWNMVELIREDITVRENSRVTFGDPTINDFSYDGTLNFSGLGAASHGVLIDHGDGTYQYIPEAGFTGKDVISYTVTNAFGNTFTARLL